MMAKIEEIREVWERQPEEFPAFLEENPDIFPKIDYRQKRENEALVQEFSKRIQKKLRQKPKNEEDRKLLELELEREFMDFFEREKILCLSEWMEPRLWNAFKREIKCFIDRVRCFDETLNREQIWQALRNYMIYAIIVELQGEEQRVSNSILAYSLLYPYTDNYIDDQQITIAEKERYNRMIASKLTGQTVMPGNLLEEKTCCLLDMILNDYTGDRQNGVAETLLLLLKAQNRSINQQKAHVTDAEILDISIRKGSTSVLADYLFAASEWLEAEELFYMKFGFFLQLLDDLQDMDEDRASGSHTLMTQAQSQQRLEQCVNRLLWFSWNVIRDFSPKNPEIKGFVLKNCVEILLAVAAANQQFFSTEYLKVIEAYLPFSLEFFRENKKKLRNSRILCTSTEGGADRENYRGIV